MASVKHEICVKYEKCIVSVSYFVVCFAKTFVKYPQNAKYETCIAGPAVHLKRLIKSVGSITPEQHHKLFEAEI